jgi:hypothetical protein
MDQDRNKAWGFVLFCDDVRQEIGGKFSAMGLYQSEYLFQGAFPYVVPKFAMLVMYYERKGAVTSDIEFRVHVPGDDPAKPSLVFPLARKDLPQLPAGAAPADDPDSEPIIHARLPIMLTPMVIPAQGFIKVRAHYDDGTILRLGRLNIRPITPHEMTALNLPSPPAE